ncbi:hypothetical protein BsWGS_26576 [Bradybaena similaris]
MVNHSLTLTSFVCCCIAVAVVLSQSTGKPNHIPNVDHHYPVHIGAEGRIVQGRVSSDAEPGDLVRSNVILEGDEDADVTIHLRVEVRDSIYKRPHMFHPNNKDNDSVIEEFINGSLPNGMHFVVIHTNAFYVNDERYITVNDFSGLNGETRIHFDVILKDSLAEAKYVSNQLHFVVEIDYPRRQTNPNAVLFAGVLVLTIMSILLLIPFVVRTKRRCRAGKPIFRCGKADDASDIESLGSVPEHLKNRTNSIGGKDNLAMILDNGRLKHPRPSVDRHTTIQNHMLRSTSGFQFQPHCMDPHYNDVYERPDFSRFENQLSVQEGTRPTQTRGSSNRSSINSDKIYPDNFNRDLSRNIANMADTGDAGARKLNDFSRKVTDVPWKMNDVARNATSVPTMNGAAVGSSGSQTTNGGVNPTGAPVTGQQIVEGVRTKINIAEPSEPSILSEPL